MASVEQIRVADPALDMQPLGKEHVDLAHMFLERGVAGLVVWYVIGGAQTFARIERNLGGNASGFSSCWAFCVSRVEAVRSGRCL